MNQYYIELQVATNSHVPNLHYFIEGRSQRRIFIFGALGCFKLGALLEGRDGRSHIFRLRMRYCSKIFQSGSGTKNFSNMRIRILFWLPSMQPKFSNVFT